MDDLHYDAMQKKIIARGARARKCGSKSKHCSLPSDRLTAKQWKERCGQVMEYNLSKPMTWAELKSMPEDIQITYLKKLSTNYALSVSTLAEMLGCHPVTARKHLQQIGAFKFYERGPGYRVPKGSLIAWEEFLNQDKEEPTDVIEEEHVCEEIVETDEERDDHADVEVVELARQYLKETTDVVTADKQKQKLSSFTFTMSGPADLMSITNSIKLFIQNGDDISLTVSGVFN